MYCGAADYGPVRGGGEEVGGTVRYVAVGIGGNLTGGGTSDGSRGDGDGRGWSRGVKEGY